MQTSAVRPPRFSVWVPECVRCYVNSLRTVDGITPDDWDRIERLTTYADMERVFDWLHPLDNNMAVAWFVAAWRSAADWNRYRVRDDTKQLAGQIAEQAIKLAELLRQLEVQPIDGTIKVQRLDYLLDAPDLPELYCADVLCYLAEVAQQVEPHHSDRVQTIIDKYSRVEQYLRAFLLSLKARGFPLNRRSLQPRLKTTIEVALAAGEGLPRQSVTIQQVNKVFISMR